LLAALQQIEQQDSETYLLLNKQAKDLGLKKQPISFLDEPINSTLNSLYCRKHDFRHLIDSNLDQFKSVVSQSPDLALTALKVIQDLLPQKIWGQQKRV